MRKLAIMMATSAAILCLGASANAMVGSGTVNGLPQLNYYAAPSSGVPGLRPLVRPGIRPRLRPLALLVPALLLILRKAPRISAQRLA